MLKGEGRLRERDARIRHRRIGAQKAPEAPFPQPFHYTNPLRQSAAHQHPLEGPTRPPHVRHGPISACGAPQPAAQRAERGFPCGCLAEHRAVWRNPGQISPLATLGRNDKGRFPVEPGMTERKFGRNDKRPGSVERTGLLSFRAKPQAESRNLRNGKSEIIVIFVD